MNAPSKHLMPVLVDRRSRPSLVTAVNQLIKLGVDPDRIFVRLVGSNEDYDGQIRSQDPDPGTPLTEETEVVLDVGMVGIVDYLPYQFFTSPQRSSAASTTWETRARGMMAPIDGTAAKMSALMSFERMRFDEAIIEPGHLSRVIDLYGDRPRSCCSANTLLGLWTALMRDFNEWSGNPRGMAWVLGLLLDCKLHVRENTPAKHQIDPAIQSRLSTTYSHLGDDWVLGDHFVDHDSRYELILTDIRQAHVEDWLPGGSRRTLLEKIMTMCNPGHLQWHLRFELPFSARPIGRSHREAFLGVSWHAGAKQQIDAHHDYLPTGDNG